METEFERKLLEKTSLYEYTKDHHIKIHYFDGRVIAITIINENSDPNKNTVQFIDLDTICARLQNSTDDNKDIIAELYIKENIKEKQSQLDTTLLNGLQLYNSEAINYNSVLYYKDKIIGVLRLITTLTDDIYIRFETCQDIKKNLKEFGHIKEGSSEYQEIVDKLFTQ